ncbi:MAG: integrase family protein, partial [Rhodospirillales bacterium]|nr:integrase family protein [Rhodospirillales bacterium]
MARTGKLSAIEVTKAKGPAVLHDGGGLYLRVAAPGKDKTQPCSKSWVFRFQLDGKRRDMGLGPFPDVSLAEARDKATTHRRQRQDGTDPLAAQQARRQAERVAIAKGRTFREAAEQFIEQNKAGWRNAKHGQQWGNTLATYVYDELGEL